MSSRELCPGEAQLRGPFSCVAAPKALANCPQGRCALSPPSKPTPHLREKGKIIEAQPHLQPGVGLSLHSPTSFSCVPSTSLLLLLSLLTPTG